MGTGENDGPGRKRHQINKIGFVRASCKPGALPAELQALPSRSVSQVAPKVGRKTIRAPRQSHDVIRGRKKMWCAAELDQECIEKIEGTRDRLVLYSVACENYILRLSCCLIYGPFFVLAVGNRVDSIAI